VKESDPVRGGGMRGGESMVSRDFHVMEGTGQHAVCLLQHTEVGVAEIV